MLLLHAFLLAMTTFIARLAFLAGPFTSTSDNVGSVRVTDAQRGRPWLHFAVSNTVIPGTYAYPPLVYWVASRLPKTWWTGARYVMNYLADTASTMLVWAAARVIAPDLPDEVALLTALAYGINPLFLPTLEHARISSPNARSLGLLLNTVWILLLGVVIRGEGNSPSAAYAAIALVPLSWLVVVTSQFGMQTMVGLTVLVSLFTRRVEPAGLMFGALIAGWFIPGLGVREVLRHKMVHWRWYRRVQTTIVNAASLRARPFRQRAAALWTLMRHPVRDGYALGTALQTSGWWKAIAGMLPWLAVLVLSASRGLLSNAWQSPDGRLSGLMALAALVMFVLTTLPRFVFLGEAERYIEHVLPAFALFALVAASADAATAMTGATLAFGITLTIVLAQLAHRQWPHVRQAMRYPAEGYDEERAMLRLLVELGRPVRIASVPVKATFLLHDLLIDEALPGSERIEFYFQHVLREGDDTFQYMLDDTSDGYTYLKPDLAQLVEKYGITMLVVDGALLYDQQNREPIVEALRQRTPMHRGRLVVYSLHDLHKPASPSVPASDPLNAVLPPPKSARQIAREREAAMAAKARESAASPENVESQPMPTAPSSSRKPRILAIADEPRWIFERHAQTLQRLLSADFDIRIQYRHDAIDEDAFDLIYPLEFDLVPVERIQSPWKYVTGIRSHISWDHYPVEPFTAYLEANFQRTHVVSRRLMALLSPTLPSVEYVTHGFDGARFSPVSRQGTPGKLRLGWAGNRRSPAKGFEQFVAPLGELPGVEIVFCGFSDRNRTVDEMPEFYASIDAYICTSSTEGSNNSLLEAAGTGAALITTRTGTVSEYLRDGESALIVPRQVEAFRRAVERLRDDVPLRQKLGMAASTAVHPAWTWDVRAGEYKAFFDRALAERGTARERMLEQRRRRVAEGKPELTVLPPDPRVFDIVSTMNRVQQAVADGDSAAAIEALELLARHDAGNPTWTILLGELRASAA